MSRINLTIEISERTSKEISMVQKITGKSVEQVLSEHLRRYLNTFRDENGNINLAEGEIHPSGVEIEMYQKSRQTGMRVYMPAEPKPKPCYILGKKRMLGTDYVTVWSQGHMMQVPAERVKEVKK